MEQPRRSQDELPHPLVGEELSLLDAVSAALAVRSEPETASEASLIEELERIREELLRGGLDLFDRSALNVRWDVETLINIPATMLIGIVLVIFAFNLATPISQIAGTVTKSTLGIATACILLAFLMMITRRKAVSQVIGFLAMENGLFFAATSATYGMPMVVELGIALDVLVGTLIFGVFFFHIRETFESLDIHHLEKLKER